MFLEFENSRIMNELNLQPKIVESNEEYGEVANSVVENEPESTIFEMELAAEEKEGSEDPLKKYNIQKKLRSTLQGELFHAIRTADGKEVAIKACRKDLIEAGLSVSGNRVLEDPRAEVRMMELMADDTQENVLQLIESFETAENFYIVMEFAARGEFFDIVSQAGRLDDEVAKHYFKQLVLGLQFIHNRGVCHLDLSLENLLMDGDGKLKICDFGLAREISKVPYKCLNRPGKIQYMSPEIFSCQDFYGEKSDMFSLGVILFVILAGFPPFDRPAVSDMRFSYILNGHLKVLLKRWKLGGVITSSAVDLLTKLLCPADQRLTIDEVLSHPWLK
jgi:serine/threonine protein kinase